MARTTRFRFSHARKIDSAFRFVSEAADAKVIFDTGAGPNARYVTINDVKLKNFASCGYMALEQSTELKEAAHDAIDRFGTQFQFSRAYLQCELYEELERLLQQITERPVVVAASTSLAHMAALPVLLSDNDHLIIDQFAHASLHTAVQLVPELPLEILRHSRMDLLETRLKELRAQGVANVWYIIDGLYSMLGDFAPFEDLKTLLRRYDNLRLYIDDAHSTSWIGKNGRGKALDHFAGDERVVVALSLNKAFGAAGGALALPNEKLASKVRRCGGPLLFSGPIQPPMLGAAVGSARLHLNDHFPGLQAELREKLQVCVRASQGTSFAVEAPIPSPIFQVPCDSPRIAFRTASLIRERGFYCCVCVFPAVPMNKPGLRFTITRHNDLEDIAPFIEAIEGCRRIAIEEM